MVEKIDNTSIRLAATGPGDVTRKWRLLCDLYEPDDYTFVIRLIPECYRLPMSAFITRMEAIRIHLEAVGVTRTELDMVNKLALNLPKQELKSPKQ